MGIQRVSRGFALFLAAGMLVTGSLNTLSNKWADVTYAMGREKRTQFNHPFIQTLGMFLGESMCLAAFFVSNWWFARQGMEERVEKADPGLKPWIFALPALCDLIGTSLMNIGLVFTYASVFQMLRGSVVIFTGIFSVIFLKRTLYAFHWFGMFLVLAGLTCVGVASVVQSSSDNNASNPLLGDILVICAQFVAAIQMVVEEKLLDKYHVPALQAVGSEGIAGTCYSIILLTIFYFIPGLNGLSNDSAHFEDSYDAAVQLSNSWQLRFALIGNMFSIAFFNFFGLSVTKTMSATTRMVLDSVRTFVIWGVSLAIGWQEFQYLQVIGFVIMLSGTIVYNRIVYIPIKIGRFEFNWKNIKEYQYLAAEGTGNASLLTAEEQLQSEGGYDAVTMGYPVNHTHPNGAIHSQAQHQQNSY